MGQHALISINNTPLHRLSVPHEGSSLESVTEARSKTIRHAVDILAKHTSEDYLEKVFQNIFAPRWIGIGVSKVSIEKLKYRAAWNLVCIWLTSRALNVQVVSFSEAERLFYNLSNVHESLLSELIEKEALLHGFQILSETQIDDNFWDLFPYILDENGPGSRNSIIRNPHTFKSREDKRKGGVFFTPSDVADYMVDHVFRNVLGSFEKIKCLDPACGTGVFLKSLLQRAKSNSQSLSGLKYIINNLYGCDISGQSLDACAFVLLNECILELKEYQISPWSAWHLIRMNLVEANTLTVDKLINFERTNHKKTYEFFKRVQNNLLDSMYVPAPIIESIPQGETFTSITKIFPEILDGFDILIGNPPYSLLNSDEHKNSLIERFQSLTDENISKKNSYTLFIEMMWKLTTSNNSASALVTPLSIAYHSGKQYVACRNAMNWAGGKWQFSFFDREPHALFGEEVKTRNAILFHFENSDTPHRGQQAEIETGPLHKWTSRMRHELFSKIRFTNIGDFNVSKCIPKVNGFLQAEVFKSLRRELYKFPSMCVQLGKCSPSLAFQNESIPRVFVGATAYNFLNVYRHLSPYNINLDSISQSPIHFLEFNSEEDANMGFAVLSSRFTFWLWHTLGDGFHVTSWLFKEIPLSKNSFTESEYQRLSELGSELWTKIKKNQFISLNKGKQTYGFRPAHCRQELDNIDNLIINAAGLPIEFCDELKNFVHRNTLVDLNDARRQQQLNYIGEL